MKAHLKASIVLIFFIIAVVLSIMIPNIVGPIIIGGLVVGALGTLYMLLLDLFEDDTW